MCLFGLLAGFLNCETNWILNYQLLFARLVWMRGLEHSVSEPPHSPSLSAAIHTIQDGVRGSVRM